MGMGSGAILQGMKIEANAVIARSSMPVETSVGSEVVLMALKSGECYGLGETGSEVWRRLAEPQTVSALVSGLREEYAAPEGVIESDVEELLGDLLKRGLVEVR